MPAPGGCADPLNWAGCATGSITSSVTNSIFSQMASWWADAYKSLMGAFSTAFLHSGDISISQFQGSGLWKLEVTVGATIAAAGVIWAGARAAWTRSGEPLATAATGLVKAVLGTAMIFTVVATLMAVADAITRAIMQSSAGDTANFANRLGQLSNLSNLGGSTALVFLFALLGVMVTAVLWVEMLIRAAGLVIVTLSAPIGAGGLVSERTAGWWKKMVRAELALVFIKPIVALVLALGFTVAEGSTGIQGVVVGFMILAASALAWPIVARLFSFFEAQVAGAGVAATLGFAGGMAGRAVGGTRSNGTQPLWRSMEAASSRGSGPSALGGTGGAASAGGPGGAAGGPAGAAGAGVGVGLAAMAAGQVARHALHVPGQMLARAADMAGVQGAPASSPGRSAPASKGPWIPAARHLATNPPTPGPPTHGETHGPQRN